MSNTVDPTNPNLTAEQLASLTPTQLQARQQARLGGGTTQQNPQANPADPTFPRTGPVRNPPPHTAATGPTGASQSRHAGSELFMPSTEESAALASAVVANTVASKATLEAIATEMATTQLGNAPLDLFSLAWSCYHNGASRLTILDTKTPGGSSHAAMKEVVENHCTLRQFCMYYAKACYNLGRETKTPPANWAAKGFKEDAKYAAFDFFNGVSNETVPPPPGGMKFNPSPAELSAHALNAKFAIVESRAQEDQRSNRGNLLAMRQVQAPNPPPMITF